MNQLFSASKFLLVAYIRICGYFSCMQPSTESRINKEGFDALDSPYISKCPQAMKVIFTSSLEILGALDGTH